MFLPSSESILDFLDTATDYAGLNSPNGNPYVVIRPSTPFVSFRGRFRDINAVYRINDLVVQNGDVMTIDPRVDIVLEERANWVIEGTLKANGTAESPIDISAAPDIDGSFTSLELSGSSTLSHVNINGGGFGAILGDEVGALVVAATTIVSDVVVRDSEGWGISCGLFATTIQNLENVTFENNQLGDIHPRCTVLD